MFSLEEKVGQMFLVGFEGLEPPPHILEWLAQGRIGGVILFSRNVQNPAQLARLVQMCHQAAKYPILVSIDQEGGDVARLRDGFTESPGAMALGAAPNGVSLAESISHMLATEIRALGINWNFAPVVDIAHNRHNPAVGSRSPGTDKKLVSRIAAAQARGFQSGGVAACAKHFPGLGNTEIDTHVALPALDTPVDDLLNNDLEPYRAVIAAGIASIMTTHTIYTTLDKEHPATVSPVVVHKMLRERLGYNGVVTTDCMEMKAITDHYAPHESSVLAALAGLDLLLYSHTRPAQEGAYEGLLAAVNSGRVPLSVIDAAVGRIQALKAKFAVKAPADLSVIRSPQHLLLTQAAARSGMVLLKNNPQVFPLQADTPRSVGVIEFASYLDSGIFETGGLTGFATLLKAKAPHFETIPLKSSLLDDAALAPALELAQNSDVTVLVTRNAHLIPEQLASARKIMDAAQRVILLCLRNPYDATLLPGADAVLCSCGGSTPSMQAAVDALLGEFIPPGTLPGLVNIGFGIMTRVQPGIENLRVEGSPLLEGRRVALFTHPAAVDSEFNNTYRIFTTSPALTLAGFFAPEHGFMGTAPEGAKIDSSTDPGTGLPVYSLYGESYRPTKDMLQNIDVIVIDIQDVGVRYYTYLWSISYIMETAGEYGVEVVILDRPNPLSDRLYGLPVYPEMESFVGRFNVPVAHGMTLGEMAQMINSRWNPTPAKLHVVPCEGMKRDMWWTDTGLDWVPTSPAMPHFSTVLHYPGACLIEGTNLSEGRGTALPFEIVGAPFIDAIALADHLNKRRLGGVRFRAHYFRPTASKHTGQDCQGVQVHILDKNIFHPFHVWLGVVREIRNLYPDKFAWLPPQGGNAAHFDRLAGSGTVREAIDDGAALTEILRDEPDYIQQFREQRKEYLLY